MSLLSFFYNKKWQR